MKLIIHNPNGQQQHLRITPTPMNKPDRPLRDYATHKTVIHGPYSDGEVDRDQLEARRTNRLISAVLWTMGGLIVTFVVWNVLSR